MELLAGDPAARQLGAPSADALVFVTPRGRGPRRQPLASARLAPGDDRRGSRGLRFHELRRTATTALVQEHIDMKTTQTRLGHADPAPSWRPTPGPPKRPIAADQRFCGGGDRTRTGGLSVANTDWWFCVFGRKRELAAQSPFSLSLSDRQVPRVSVASRTDRARARTNDIVEATSRHLCRGRDARRPVIVELGGEPAEAVRTVTRRAGVPQAQLYEEALRDLLTRELAKLMHDLAECQTVNNADLTEEEAMELAAVRAPLAATMDEADRFLSPRQLQVVGSGGLLHG